MIQLATRALPDSTNPITLLMPGVKLAEAPSGDALPVSPEFAALVAGFTPDDAQASGETAAEPGADRDVNTSHAKVAEDESDDSPSPLPVIVQTLITPQPYREWMQLIANTDDASSAESGSAAVPQSVEAASPVESLDAVAEHAAFEIEFRASHPGVERARSETKAVPAASVNPTSPANATPVAVSDRVVQLDPAVAQAIGTRFNRVNTPTVKESVSPTPQAALASTRSTPVVISGETQLRTTPQVAVASTNSTGPDLLVAAQSTAVPQPPVASTVSAVSSPNADQMGSNDSAPATPETPPRRKDVARDQERPEPQPAAQDKQNDRAKAASAEESSSEASRGAGLQAAAPSENRETGTPHMTREVRATPLHHDAMPAPHSVAGTVAERIENRATGASEPPRAADVLAEAPLDTPRNANASPVSSLRMTVDTPNGEAVKLHISDRGGQVRVVARTTDPNLSNELKQGVPQLLNALQDAGVSGATETSTSSDRQRQDEQSDSRQSGQHEQRDNPHEGRRDQRRQQRHRNDETFVMGLNSAKAHFSGRRDK